MARLNKEQQAYLDGMAYAYKLAKEDGIEELEKEIKYRGITNLPLNVKAKEVIAVARNLKPDERVLIATASAATLIEVVKMPPSMVMGYLIEFNKRVILYSTDKDEYEQAQRRLDINVGLNDVCKIYAENEEAK